MTTLFWFFLIGMGMARYGFRQDAARIFDEVEMPILLLVIDKMSEKKAAPILAEMDPKKAKQITVQLAEQRRVSPSRTNTPGKP